MNSKLHQIKRADINRRYISVNRRYIYEHILMNPGIHLRQICKETGLTMEDTQHHLFILVKEGRIKSKKIGQHKHRHYYPMAVISEQHELILANLRLNTPRDILIYLIEHSGSTQSQIANFKNFKAPTIKWHMSRLIEAGIVMGIREGKTLHYFIKDPESLIDSLRNYFPTIWSKLADKFANLLYSDFHRKEKKCLIVK